jgi:hypothetical protein
MPATLVYWSRWKLIVLGVGNLLVALLCLAVGLSGEPLVLLGVPLFAIGPIVAVVGLRRRTPVIVIDDSGIEEARAGLRLGWDEIESIRLVTSYPAHRGFIPVRTLMVRPRNIEAVEERLSRKSLRRLAVASRRLGFRSIEIGLTMLSTGYRKILEAIERHSGGAFSVADTSG